MSEYLIGGYISVAAVYENSSREVYKLVLDKERQSRISSASYHFPEKAQYKKLFQFVSERSTPVEYLSSREFDALASGEAYGGIAAFVGDRRFSDIGSVKADARFALILDGIEDPFNFGYILRTAYACGCGHVLLPQRNYFTSSSIVIRSSAGASEMLDISLYSSASEACGALRNEGYSIVCTAKDARSVPFDKAVYRAPLCLVIGGEKRGINKSLLSQADTVVCIDYKNEYRMSLSASSAASILIHGIASRI